MSKNTRLRSENNMPPHEIWYVFFSEREQRDFYYEPISRRVQWAIPENVNQPSKSSNILNIQSQPKICPRQKLDDTKRVRFSLSELNKFKKEMSEQKVCSRDNVSKVDEFTTQDNIAYGNEAQEIFNDSRVEPFTDEHPVHANNTHRNIGDINHSSHLQAQSITFPSCYYPQSDFDMSSQISSGSTSYTEESSRIDFTWCEEIFSIRRPSQSFRLILICCFTSFITIIFMSAAHSLSENNNAPFLSQKKLGRGKVRFNTLSSMISKKNQLVSKIPIDKNLPGTNAKSNENTCEGNKDVEHRLQDKHINKRDFDELESTQDTLVNLKINNPTSPLQKEKILRSSSKTPVVSSLQTETKQSPHNQESQHKERVNEGKKTQYNLETLTNSLEKRAIVMKNIRECLSGNSLHDCFNPSKVDVKISSMIDFLSKENDRVLNIIEGVSQYESQCKESRESKFLLDLNIFKESKIDNHDHIIPESYSTGIIQRNHFIKEPNFGIDEAGIKRPNNKDPFGPKDHGVRQGKSNEKEVLCERNKGVRIKRRKHNCDIPFFYLFSAKCRRQLVEKPLFDTESFIHLMMQ